MNNNNSDLFFDILFDNTAEVVEKQKQVSKYKHVTRLYRNGVLAAVRTIEGDTTTYEYHISL